MKKENEVIKKRKAHLIMDVMEKLPQFSEMCATSKKNNYIALLHQDAFAAEYQDEEYLLLGKVIKYAGIIGLEVRIIGKNEETLKK